MMERTGAKKNNAVEAASLTELPKLEEMHAIFEGRHFSRHINEDGTVGGFVESTAKVSDTVYIGKNALVLDNARVFGHARVYDYAQVSDDVWIFDRAQVFGHSRVFNKARIFDRAQVFGHAQVFGDAQVFGHTQIFGNVILRTGGLCSKYSFNSQEDLELWFKKEKEFEAEHSKRLKRIS